MLKDGWHLQNEGDGTMNLVRKHRHIPVHFKRNSLCATGVIRMLTENTDVSSSTSSSSARPLWHKDDCLILWSQWCFACIAKQVELLNPFSGKQKEVLRCLQLVDSSQLTLLSILLNKL